MLKIDENAVICDLAETYQIYDYKKLPLSLVASFAVGLRDDSRIKMKLSGMTVPLETFLLGGIYDSLSILVWFQTKDGQKGVRRPDSISKTMLSNEPKNKDVVVFNSGEEFEEMREKIVSQIGGESIGD